LALAALLLPLAPLAADATFAVNAPWVRFVKGATSAEVFMELQSSVNATLVDARTEAAKKVTIRPPGTRPAPIAELPLPAGVPVHLVPGGIRLGLLRLTGTLKLGDRIPLTLIIRQADGRRREIPINAEVRRRSPIDDERRAHAH
jgi:copper(I)-binding protein